MGRPEIIMLLAVLGGCVLLLVLLMSYMTHHHGSGLRKARKKSRQDILGYNPSKVSSKAVSCAVSCFVCGLMVAMNAFTDRH